jgi:glycosyltransferase involved in cell wall biosynthesis
MNTNPLVSIIIGFLNAEKFIQEAIESVIAQTYHHWELFLVDDGSTDKSTAIARRYVQQYPEKVFYLEHEGHQNLGVCVSRNWGIKHARGEYIAILDADDVWLPHKLERQVEILNAHPEAAMVYGVSEYWTSWTSQPEDAWRNYRPKPGVNTNTLFKSPSLVTLCYPLGTGAAPCPSDILLRREILQKIGGFEEDFTGAYQLFEDQAFLIKVYLNGAVFVSDECWDRYRQHPASCMARVADQAHTVRLFFLNWLADYLTKQDVTDPKIWKALDKAFWPYRHPVMYGLLKPVQGLAAAIKRQATLLKQRILYSQ